MLQALLHDLTDTSTFSTEYLLPGHEKTIELTHSWPTFTIQQCMRGLSVLLGSFESNLMTDGLKLKGVTCEVCGQNFGLKQKEKM